MSSSDIFSNHVMKFYSHVHSEILIHTHYKHL